MTPKAEGRRRPAPLQTPRARLHHAEAFLETAETATDADVKATNAVHAGIPPPMPFAAWHSGHAQPMVNHSAAVELLHTVDRQLASSLARLVARKQQAAYESRDISAKDATTCIRQATSLVEAARGRSLTG